MTNRAIDKGTVKAKDAYDEQVVQPQKNGAGPAQKRTAIYHALPSLRLTFKETTKEGTSYTTDPIQVTTKHIDAWCNVWGAYDSSFEKMLLNILKLFAPSISLKLNGLLIR